MLFPIVIAALAHFHIGLNWGCILLMLLGTQWYILFNVIAGAMAIPGDLKEAATSYRLAAWQRFKVALPARRLPLPGHGLGHRRRRRLERQHRGRVRTTSTARPSAPSAWAPP